MPNQFVTDPNLTNTLAGTLQLSGLGLTANQAGYPLQVVFTATNIGSPYTSGYLNASDSLTGLICTTTNVIVDKLRSTRVTLGPFGGLAPSRYEAVSLFSLNPLPAEYAGQTLDVFVGPDSEVGQYQVGQTFYPDPATVLEATFVVQGTAAHAPAGGLPAGVYGPPYPVTPSQAPTPTVPPPPSGPPQATLPHPPEVPPTTTPPVTPTPSRAELLFGLALVGLGVVALTK